MASNPFYVMTRAKECSVSELAQHHSINKLVAARTVAAMEHRPRASPMINRSHVILVEDVREGVFPATLGKVWRIWMARLDNARILVAARAEIKNVVWNVFEDDRTIVSMTRFDSSDFEREVFVFNKEVHINHIV
jgi:hypothetical protein